MQTRELLSIWVTAWLYRSEIYAYCMIYYVISIHHVDHLIRRLMNVLTALGVSPGSHFCPLNATCTPTKHYKIIQSLL